MKKEVLGVKIDDVNIDQALKIVQGWLSKRDKHYIVTPNPEIVVMAQADKQLKEIINSADLAIPDGFGLKLAGDIVCNTPGIDLMEALMKLASENGFTAGFLGGKDKVAEKSAECLKKKYPKLKISFVSDGGEIDNNGDVIARSETTKQSTHPSYGGRKEIATLPSVARNDGAGVDLLFVAFGPPKQEKWIAKNLHKIPVKMAMVVGGAFDYISGRVPRAPKWVRNLGLEWLFRLMVEPWRIKRQFALIKYLWLLTKDKYNV